MGFLAKLFSGNEREIAKMRKVVDVINSYEPEMEKLSDAQLRAKTDEFKKRLADGATLDDLLPEAFAVVREASKRTIGMRHFDVQMIGGLVLHQGRVAEMKTGEGKTLVATLPLYLNALEGKGAHLITVNDYLAKLHANWMGKVYNFLGLSVGALQGSDVVTGEMEASYLFDPDFINDEDQIYEHLRRSDKRDSYMADITYGTNHVYGFDYLRDNMAFSKDELAQRELHYAIVDEVDSILIDEARTPLIISGQAAKSTDLYKKMDRIAARLEVGRDYTIDEKAKNAMLTEEGMERVEQALGIENLSDDPELMHHASAALKARVIYKKDIDYMVKDNQVIIVDEFTGRLMFGRRWGDGLHQAVEAKENVKIEHESQTLATITYQNYFRLYGKLAGMTGTAKTEEEEFRKIYALDVVIIPTNKPMLRKDHPDTIHKTAEAKFRGLTLEILQLHTKFQPVLVGTRSIEISELVSERLKPERLQLLAAIYVLRSKLEEQKQDGDTRKTNLKFINQKLSDLTLSKLLPLARTVGMSMDMLVPENVDRFAGMLAITDKQQKERLHECLAQGIPHNVLNAKYHEREAEIIAEAGRVGAVTIATNMAGRGVDILLGGKMEDPTADRHPEHEKVVELGGLCILGSERHESRRIDNQLRGRAGRQGDPGVSRFHVSMEDELVRVFGDKAQSPLLNAWEEDMSMDSGILSKMIERTQMKMEEHYFEIRKHVLQYDDVMNVQREVIYGQRRKILEGADLRATLTGYLHKTVTDAINSYCPSSLPPSEWDTDTLYEFLNQIYPLHVYAKPEHLKSKNGEQLEDFLLDTVDQTYEDREKELTPELMREMERHIALRSINDKWMEHLDAMDYLREGIHLRGYAQIDPLVAYKKEAFEMFERTMESIQDEMIRLAYRIRVEREKQEEYNPYRNIQMYGGDYVPTALQHPDQGGPDEFGDMPALPSNAPTQAKQRAGRNDPCPCGSGKKYKKCCLIKDSPS